MRCEIYCNHWIYECLDQVYECIAFICGIWNKKSFEVFNSTRKYFEKVGVSVRICSFVEISHEYEKVAWLIGIYRANTTALSVFFVGDTQGPILDTTYQGRNP